MKNSYLSPTGKENPGLLIALVAANLLMLVVGIITIPPNLRGSAEKADPRPAVVSPASVAMPTTAPVDTPAANIQTPAPGALSADLSTQERPDLGDFLWYTEDVFYNGVPADAAAMSSFEEATGGWKALIVYDPEGSHDASGTEFLNISLAGTAENSRLTLDWYLIFWSGDGTSFDETGMEDSVFNGQWADGSLLASGAGTIHLTQFYALNDKQYAIGTMDTPDGIPAFIALVRP